jgi:hypothetical protein
LTGTPVIEWPAIGEVFLRSASMTNTWFTETITLTNVGPLTVWIGPGTPVTSGNADVPNTLSTLQKMVYQGPTVLPVGVPVKVCVVDAKGGAGSNATPGGFAGLKINTSKLPLKQTGWTGAQLNRVYVETGANGWQGRLDIEKIAWFSESVRQDNQPK